MIRQLLQNGGLLAGVALVSLLVGCNPQQPFYLNEDGDLSHYVGVATEIEYPDVDLGSLDEVEGAMAPATVINFDHVKIEDITLEDAVRIALENSKIMRSLGGVAFGASGVQGDPSGLLSNPSGTPTTYLPALTESDPRYGVEAALAAFDTQFTTSAFWEKNDTPQNATGFVTAFRPRVFAQDLGTFQAQLRKTAATGGTWSLTHNVDYEWNNATGSRKWPSDWNVNLQAEFRQPLMQGAGVQYNRIAGPGAIPGFNNGVMIARLRTDISLTDFEAGVRNLVNDVERAYWNLYFAYRRLDTAVAGRDSTLRAWQTIKVKRDVQAEGGTIQSEAQARNQYFLFQAVVEQSQSNLFKNENVLRYALGLSPTDGRLFRPSDEPTRALARFDWNEVLAEGLSRSVELRRQKWVIKQRELELIAAKNYLLPRLDAVGRYRWLGLGDILVEGTRKIDADGDVTNAYGSMTSGRFQEWQLGLELSIPLGFRQEMAGVRNAQLALARERAVLQEQELELTHQLSSAVREIDQYYTTTKTNFSRVLAAKDEVDGRRAVWVAGVDPKYEGDAINLYLNALQRQAEAENEYFRSLVDYNVSIAQIHYRKGSLLEYNGVYMSEGPWTGKAYFDALRRARARDASYYLDYGFTRPGVISRGPYEQHAGQPEAIFETQGAGEGVLEGGELIPTPDPLQTPPGADRQTSRPALRVPRLGGNWTKPAAAEAKSGSKHDLANHLDVLGPRSKQATAEDADLVPAGFETPVESSSSTVVAFAAPKIAVLQSPPEPAAKPAPVRSDSTATGWKRKER